MQAFPGLDDLEEVDRALGGYGRRGEVVQYEQVDRLELVEDPHSIPQRPRCAQARPSKTVGARVIVNMETGTSRRTKAATVPTMLTNGTDRSDRRYQYG